MNNKDQIAFYFKKYRPQFVPIALYFFGLFILTRILLPQIGQFQTVRNELRSKQGDVDQLEQSLQSLQSLDAEQLQDTYDLVSKALPLEQDVALVIASLNATAIRSNIEINGYSVNPGKIYQKKEETSENTAQQVIQSRVTPSLDLDLRVSADDLISLVKFIHNLQESLPLSEVQEIQARDGDGTITVRFFYQPLDRAALGKKNVITPLKTSDLELIAKLKNFSS